ncbi:MAG: hypothetical protein ACPG5Z_00260 [Pseudoalteromonas sp.]
MKNNLIDKTFLIQLVNNYVSDYIEVMPKGDGRDFEYARAINIFRDLGMKSESLMAQDRLFSSWKNDESKSG